MKNHAKLSNANKLERRPLSAERIYLFHTKIARNVARIRKERGISQLDLALSIGHKSVSLVSGAESGYNGIHFNLEQLYRIAHALEVPMTDFFDGVGEVDIDSQSYDE